MNMKRGFFTLSIIVAVVVATMTVGSPAFAALSQYWTFDTDAANSAPGGIDGTFVGTAGVSNVTGEYLKGTGALKLSHDTAGGDYVNIFGAAIPTYHPTAFTVTTWFKSDETLGSQPTDSRQFLWETAPSYTSGAGMSTSDHQIQWYMEGTPTIGLSGQGGPINDGQWHHIAIVYDYPNGSVDYYLDGGEFGYPNITEDAGVLLQPTSSMNIGNHRLGDGSRNWKGYIDDFAIYNGTIDGAGVTGLYNGTFTPQTVPVTDGPDSPPDIPTSPLQAYWTFDSNYDSTVNNSFYQGTPEGDSFTSISNVTGEFIRGTGALKLDSGDSSGNGTYVDISREVAAPSRDRQVTVSAWYNYTDISSDGSDSRNAVYESSSTYSLSYGLRDTGGDRDGEWFYEYTDGAVSDTTGPPVTPGEWNHIVMVLDMDAERIQYYHNGEIINEISTDGREIAAMDGFHIGNHRGADGSRDFDGYIDDMAVFHGTLSPEAVAELYNGTKTPETVTVDAGLGTVDVNPVEEGWTLERTISFEDASGIAYNPTDGKIYVGRRQAEASGGGVYTIAADDSVELVVGANSISGLIVDPADGDVFMGEDAVGDVTRFASGDTVRAEWVTEFDNTVDDDPVGMAIVPDSYTGGLVPTGSAISVDRGSGGFEEVWVWSLDTAEGETTLISDSIVDDGAGNVLIDPSDVAVTTTGIYVCDAGGNKIYEITAADTLVELATSEFISSPLSMVADPLTGDLLVMTGTAKVVRIDTDTGDVSDVIEHIGYSISWDNMFITPDGLSLFIADMGLDAVYEFSFTPEDRLPGDANGDGIVDDDDAAALAANWQGTGKYWYQGDFNGDGVVNDIDATILAANWQATSGSGASVPEPGVLALLAAALASLLLCGRRKR